MTPKLRQICGCELCIITKYMQINLNRFGKKLVIDLQQKTVSRNTLKSIFITKRDAHYKKKVFPDGELLHATIRYAAQ